MDTSLSTRKLLATNMYFVANSAVFRFSLKELVFNSKSNKQ